MVPCGPEISNVFRDRHQPPISANRDRHQKLIRFSACCSAYRILIRFGGIRLQPVSPDQTPENRRQKSNDFSDAQMASKV
jgi:hypothetical protein